jgi:prepilin-type N-terminal cleavage/methylation domain-containing protein/prepilin-type processing-associated H-X9-DG protein
MVLRIWKNAFTLIELLVVIAIIGFLLAVIVPALHQAKLCAKQVVCAAQMKQWALAAIAYVGENSNTVPVYSDVCDNTKSENAKDPTTLWHNRLSPYLTGEYHGLWGMDYGNRRCPMARTDWGDNAVWIGVFFGKYNPEHAPFIQPYQWTGSNMIKRCSPVKFSSIRLPANYLMLLDVKRDVLFDPVHWDWDTDHDGDGMNDSCGGLIASSMAAPYNAAQPKIHRGGCNVALFDGHVEWIGYETFWEIGADGYPVHPFWWNQNRP